MKDAPGPIGSPRLEDHTKEPPERAPSSGSLADPKKVILSVVMNVEPSAGLSMDAVGGELTGGGMTLMTTELLCDAPWLSVAVSVMVWAPAPREAVKDASLTDRDGRLEGRGKMMRHLKVRTLGQADPDQIASWV